MYHNNNLYIYIYMYISYIYIYKFQRLTPYAAGPRTTTLPVKEFDFSLSHTAYEASHTGCLLSDSSGKIRRYQWWAEFILPRCTLIQINQIFRHLSFKVSRSTAPEQKPSHIQELTVQVDKKVTSKSPVGDISVVTLIRTDTTLDHSQKAEKV